jgi:integrase/recombinase XerD
MTLYAVPSRAVTSSTEASGDAVRGITMEWPILVEFAQFQEAKGLSGRTISNRDYMLRALARECGTDPVEVTIHHLRARIGRGIGKGSMQTERDCFRAFFAFMKDELYRTDDPTERLVRIRRPKGRPRPFTVDQVDDMLTTGSYRRTRAMIVLASKQGFRAAEVAAVHGHDFDLIAGTIRVVGKGDKYAVLPLHPAVRELAETMPRTDWWFPARRGEPGHIRSKSVSDLMRKAKLRAGITNDRLTGHSLRHAYGTDLVRAGVDLRTVQELMRHESLATTQIYTLIDDEQMRSGIVRLPVAANPTHSGRKAA